MTWRALIVFLWGLLIIRLGDRRLLGKNANLDVLLTVVLGSVLSRGINGQAPFFPTLGVSAMLVLFHHLLGTAAYHSKKISCWTKGTANPLVLNGVIQAEEMRRCKITYDDLEENLRFNGNVNQAAEVSEARLERNGGISVVKKS